MSSELPGQEPAASWRSDPDLRRVDVVVCTTAGTFVGHTYRSSRARLLDALNKGFAARGTRIGLDYIPLTEVEAYLPGGERGTMASAHIRKANVILVAERLGGQPEGDTAKAGRVATAKKPVEASVRTTQYLLTGRLHSAAWAELVTSLHQEEAFVPMTRVRISPPLATGESEFEFAAFNKDQVIYVGESSG